MKCFQPFPPRILVLKESSTSSLARCLVIHVVVTAFVVLVSCCRILSVVTSPYLLLRRVVDEEGTRKSFSVTDVQTERSSHFSLRPPSFIRRRRRSHLCFPDSLFSRVKPRQDSRWVRKLSRLLPKNSSRRSKANDEDNQKSSFYPEQRLTSVSQNCLHAFSVIFSEKVWQNFRAYETFSSLQNTVLSFAVVCTSPRLSPYFVFCHESERDKGREGKDRGQEMQGRERVIHWRVRHPEEKEWQGGLKARKSHSWGEVSWGYN